MKILSTDKILNLQKLGVNIPNSNVTFEDLLPFLGPIELQVGMTTSKYCIKLISGDTYTCVFDDVLVNGAYKALLQRLKNK